MKSLSLETVVLLLLFAPHFLQGDYNGCKPSGKVKGKKPPPGHCNEDDNICCIEGRFYTTYRCSPAVSESTKAVLNLNGFEKGGDGYSPARCDHKYHSDSTPVVALSTGWYNRGRRCLKNITISGNGKSVDAMVVDECVSSIGCNADSDYLPPCGNNIVGASEAVWKALGVPVEDWGEIDVVWSDA
ncbi:putative ripening-related protein 2 [Andrographis paniculata]|uniref:putative ripening-related protein 2 n=1 Tax=Andrographis paniculata TaxID=175694 RepID=UPI0021E83E63|nr:putative ripening-related protein 2 [Andrographis paniculata]